MAKIIRLTESDLTKIVRRVLEEQPRNPPTTSRGGLPPNRGGARPPLTTPPPNRGGVPKLPPSKPKVKPITPKACKLQMGDALKIFKGSDVNLYEVGSNPAVDQPTMPKVCINSILKMKDNIMKVGASNNIINMFKETNGWILVTDQKDPSGRFIKLYYECGADSLRNENLKELINLSSGLMKGSGSSPIDLQQADVFQENVIGALKNLCMKNPQGLSVPKVQNPKFAQTKQNQSGNV